MARPIYSEQLIKTTVSPGSSATFICPVGIVAIVRDIEGLVSSSLTEGGELTLDWDGIVWARWTWPTNFLGSISWTGRVTQPGPATLTATVNGLSCFSEITVSGYELTP